MRAYTEIFGYAPGYQPKVAGRRITAFVEHPVQGFFAQTGLHRQFFEGDSGVNQIAQYREALGCFAFKKRVHGLGVERLRKIAVALNSRHNRMSIFSCQGHGQVFL